MANHNIYFNIGLQLFFKLHLLFKNENKEFIYRCGNILLFGFLF